MREQENQFDKFFLKVREDDIKFFNYFRMSKSSFDELHEKLQNKIESESTQFRNSIPTVAMLAITLRYLASGCTYNFKIGISTARKIVRKVCSAIWLIMNDECFPKLTKERWKTISSDFETTANFPHCLGAVDGKHIRIIRPIKSGSMYFNYKGYFSVVLMAVADSQYRFINVNIGSFGKDCDSSIFKRGSLWKAIESKSLQLPEEKCLPGTSGPKVPYYLIGDEAFGLHKHLLRPYGGSNLSLKKRIFNYRLCRARRFIECAFGILSNKWRIFHRSLNVHPTFAVIIIKACIVLHNFVRDRDGFVPEETTTIIGLENLQTDDSVRGGLLANSVRDIVSDYFLTNVGSVPWQMDKI